MKRTIYSLLLAMTLATTSAHAQTDTDNLPAELLQALEALRGQPGQADALFNDLRDQLGIHDSAIPYLNTIAPLFEARCAKCHGPTKIRGGLDLVTPSGIMRGGDNGAAIVPGDASASLLMRHIRHEEEPGMPYKEDKLPEAEIEAIAAWIEAGAELPNVGIEAAPTSTEMIVTDEDRSFWSFRPLRNPDVPPVEGNWARNEIDHFILAQMRDHNLSPTPEADKRTLIRRAYCDLIGLPPTPEEIEAFVHDNAPDAYERVVDELLASPHYGERWGRHWLDLARYADSSGYEFDYERPNAYPYRDFVIKALNDDMPYDQFVQWQLAGDEYEPDNPEAIAATGFLAAGPNVNNQDNEENFYNEMDDIASTTASTFLGMTMACARCHDHKYDPMPTRDYYRIVSAFTTTKRGDQYMATRAEARAYTEAKKAWDSDLRKAQHERNRFLEPFRKTVREARIDAVEESEENKALLKARFDKDNETQKKLREKHKALFDVKDEVILEGRSEEELAEWAKLDEAVQAVEAVRPKEPRKVFASRDTAPTPKESYLLNRGNHSNKKEVVTLGFLSVLPGTDSPTFDPARYKQEDVPSTFQRTALAEWLTNVDEGAGRLSLRVMANRMWHYHFGRGIVNTPNDFGIQGDRPTHPDLLDWLAGQIVRDGWHLKPMHKRIMMSATYRQASAHDPARQSADPDNIYLSRFEPRRVEAEVVRDAMLKVSGTLNPDMYGRPVFPFMHPDAIATGSTDKWPKDVVDDATTWRRSIYINIRRSVLVPMMESFDAPDATASCAVRNATTVPSQALTLMNSRFAIDQATHFSNRLQEKYGDDMNAIIEGAFKEALGRAPRDGEKNLAAKFIAQQAKNHEAAGREGQAEALIDFCQTIFALNEFVYIS